MDISSSTIDSGSKPSADPVVKTPLADSASKAPREAVVEPSSAERMLRAQISAQGLPLPEEGERYHARHVADRILGFIRDRVERASPEDRQQLLAEARAGVEQGLQSAEDALAAAGLLDDISDDLAATRERLFDNLAAYAKELRTEAAQAPVTERVLSTQQSGTAQTAAVQIKTRDGDTVNVDISRLSASAQVSVASSGESGQVAGSAKASLSAVRIEYSVEGELDKHEQKAVDRLLRRVDNIAAHFFDGQLQAAFSQASALGVKGKQLAEFSFTLEQRSVLKAMTEYQTVSSGDTAKASVARGGAQALGDFVNQVRELFSQADNDSLLDISKQSLADMLLKDINERSLGGLGEELATGALSLLEDLIDHLLSADEDDSALNKDDEAASLKVETMNESSEDKSDGSVADPIRELV